MNIGKIKPLYLLLASLFFILMINGAFFYFYLQKPAIKTIKQEENYLIDYNRAILNQEQTNSQAFFFEINNEDYILGDKNARIEMIVYDDPTDPFALEYFQVIKTLKKEFKDDLKIALRLLPLNISNYSEQSSLAVLCAGEQDKYFEMYEELIKANFDNRITKKYFSKLTDLFVLDNEKFSNCLSEEAARKRLNVWKDQAESNSIIGVPSTFINNYPYPGSYQLDDFIDSSGFQREGLRTVIKKRLDEQMIK